MGKTVRVDGSLVSYDTLPLQYQQTMRHYIEGGFEPGSGFYAILRNDLAAVTMVSDETYADLRQIYRWLINYAPMRSWGSTEKVNSWMKARQAERHVTYAISA